jgi:DTW domain-containing protein YfiP
VDREQYQKNKRQQQHQFESETRRRWCLTCRRKMETCLCHALKPFESTTIISLLMHPKEAKKQRLGTGHLSHAILKNSRTFSEVNLDEDREFQKFLKEPDLFHMLLYPATDAWPIDGNIFSDRTQENLVSPVPKGKKLVLHVLDATWPCAKKMMRVSQILKDMPKVSFCQNYRSRFLIKHQPHEACLSTIETLYYCLESLKGQGLEPQLQEKHQNLLNTLDALVQFQVKCEHDPDIPSSRGRKPQGKGHLKEARIRAKKNRLFYWDIKRSPVGRGKPFRSN